MQPRSATIVRPARSTSSNNGGFEHDPKKYTRLDDMSWLGDTQLLHLPSGAQLSYARLGRAKKEGQVWVVFHGTPGCRIGGFDLYQIDANPMQWYHRLLDVNTPSDAASATVGQANRYRKHMEYVEEPDLDRFGIQQKRHIENLRWLLK